jgi:hypothetical protein
MPAGASTIDDVNEDLLRQVHPTQLMLDGRPDSSAFSPSPSDTGLLSTRRQWITAERAHSDWIASQKLSVGTWGIRQGDFTDADLLAYDDSSINGNPEGHASVDFTAFAPSRHRKIGRKLRDASCERGCLYQPTPEASADSE